MSEFFFNDPNNTSFNKKGIILNYANRTIENQLSDLLRQGRYKDALLKAEKTLYNISYIKIVSFMTILLCFEEFYLLSLDNSKNVESKKINIYLLDHIILFFSMLAFYISFDEDNIKFLEHNIKLLRTIADNQLSDDSFSLAHIIAKEVINEIDLLHYAQQLIKNPHDENIIAKQITSYLLDNRYQKNREYLHFLKYYHPILLTIFVKICIKDFLNQDERAFIFRVMIQYDKNVLTKFLSNPPIELQCPILHIFPVIPVKIKDSAEVYDLHSLKTLANKNQDNNVKNHPLRLNTIFKISELIYLTENEHHGFLDVITDKLNSLTKEHNNNKKRNSFNAEMFKKEKEFINTNYFIAKRILSIDLINEQSYTKEVFGKIKKVYFGEKNAFFAKFSIFMQYCLQLDKVSENSLNAFIEQGAKSKINSPEIINEESHTALSLLTNGYIYNTEETPYPRLLNERIKWLLRNGADINLHDEKNQSPLITAAKNSAKALIILFLQNQEPTLEILDSAISSAVDPEIKNILEDYHHQNYLYDVFNNKYIPRKETQYYVFSHIVDKCVTFRNKLCIDSLHDDSPTNSPTHSPIYQMR